MRKQKNPASVCSPHHTNPMVEEVLTNRMRWYYGEYHSVLYAVNGVLLALLVADLYGREFVPSLWDYTEFSALVLSTVFMLGWLVSTVANKLRRPIPATSAQLELLGLSGEGASLDEPKPKARGGAVKKPVANTTDPLLAYECTLSRWYENRSDFESSHCSPGRRSPNPSPGQSPHSSYADELYDSSIAQFNESAAAAAAADTSDAKRSGGGGKRFVSPYKQYDEDSSKIYDLQGVKEFIKKANARKSIFVDPAEVFRDKTYGFWNYYNRTANLLRTSIYQLAPQNPPSTKTLKLSPNNREESIFEVNESTSERIRSTPSYKLSHYSINMRRWISTTILKPLVEQIDMMNDTFNRNGFPDVQIGTVSLERLYKIMKNPQFVLAHFPMLTLILPFLELTTNQEYLVRRLRELADGSCISVYCWNGGGDYGAYKWNEHLPNDTAILFHMLCAYLDSQLCPLPQGEGPAFFGRYVIAGDEKRSNKATVELVKNRARCAILYWNTNEPRFNFICDQQIHRCVYNRNNFFYVLIDFLMYMRDRCDSMLEGVHMGPSGINIMCTIED